MADTCDSCTLSLREFVRLCDDKARLLEFLQRHNVLRKYKVCPLDGNTCRFNSSSNRWVCGKMRRRRVKKGKTRCPFTQSLFKNTWFENSKMPFDRICEITLYWATLRAPRSDFIKHEMGVGMSTVIAWSNYCREVCMHWVESTSEKLGGEGKTVEIDKAKLSDSKWVFGGFERDSKKMFLVPVFDLSKETLLRVIKDWILPGTEIMSDSFKGYQNLDAEGFSHLKVDHRVNFIDPVSGAHTQNMTRMWQEIRSKVPRRGVRKEDYFGHLCEFLWKRNFPCHTHRLHTFFKDMIAIVFDPYSEDATGLEMEAQAVMGVLQEGPEIDRKEVGLPEEIEINLKGVPEEIKLDLKGVPEEIEYEELEQDMQLGE